MPIYTPNNSVFFPTKEKKNREKEEKGKAEREKAPAPHLVFGPPEPAGPAGQPASLGRSLPFPVPPTRVGTGARPRRTPPRRRRGGDKIASAPASTDPSPRRLGLLPTYLHQLPSPSRPLSLSLVLPSPERDRRRSLVGVAPTTVRRAADVPELPLRRPRRPRASGRAGVPCSGRVKLFPNLGRRRPPRFIPPPLCAPVHSRASVCRAVSLHPLLLPLVPPHTP